MVTSAVSRAGKYENDTTSLGFLVTVPALAQRHGEKFPGGEIPGKRVPRVAAGLSSLVCKSIIDHPNRRGDFHYKVSTLGPYQFDLFSDRHHRTINGVNTAFTSRSMQLESFVQNRARRLEASRPTEASRRRWQWEPA